MQISDCFSSRKLVQSRNHAVTSWKRPLALSLARALPQDREPAKLLLRADRAGRVPPERGFPTRARRYRRATSPRGNDHTLANCHQDELMRRARLGR